jgi:putative heme-binding domain-containing protein
VQAVRIVAGSSPAALLDHPALVSDASPLVRRQILLELAGAPKSAPVDDALLTLALAFDGSDRFYREAIGIAFKGREEWAWDELLARLGARWTAQLAGLAVQLHPPAVVDIAANAASDDALDIALRKLALQALDATGAPEAGAAIASFVTNREPPEIVAYALELLAFDGGDRWRAALDASGVDGWLGASLRNDRNRDAALAFIADARRSALVPGLFEIALDDSHHIGERVRALQAAAPVARADNTGASAVTALLMDEQMRIVAETMKLIARFDVPFARQQLHDYLLDETRPLALRRFASTQIVQTRAGATTLLKSIEEGVLPAALEFDAGEALRECRFKDVRERAVLVLPPETTRDGTPLPTLAELKNLSGDASRGRGIFFSEDRSQCYQCHVIGAEGRRVGPDLTKIGEKYGKDGLFESILNPSAAVSHEYAVWVVETRNGDVLTGYLRNESAENVVLMDSTGNPLAIPASDISGRYRSNMSLMPNGLAAGMTAQELADVVAFLESLK